jgi:hypothetical protein
MGEEHNEEFRLCVEQNLGQTHRHTDRRTHTHTHSGVYRVAPQLKMLQIIHPLLNISLMQL